MIFLAHVKKPFIPPNPTDPPTLTSHPLQTCLLQSTLTDASPGPTSTSPVQPPSTVDVSTSDVSPMLRADSSARLSMNDWPHGPSVQKPERNVVQLLRLGVSRRWRETSTVGGAKGDSVRVETSREVSSSIS